MARMNDKNTKAEILEAYKQLENEKNALDLQLKQLNNDQSANHYQSETRSKRTSNSGCKKSNEFN